MKIFISEADRQSARRIAIKNIARFYNLTDWESMPNDELLNEIYALNEKSAVEISALLKNYFKAYDNWFAFYQERRKIETKSGTEYNLNSNEQIELGVLINQRQTALDALQLKFDELQLSKYDTQTFGNDISGILNTHKT